jgi:YceI-like domain
MKKISWLLLALFFAGMASAQDKYFTKTGKASFDATSPGSPEQVEGIHKSVLCVLDTKTGNMQFSVAMKGFEFERALMQEHFNENYIESDQFPKSEFKGMISNNTTVNYTADGEYKVSVKGKLTIHGITKDIETNGNLVVKNGKITATSVFTVLLADYKISIPGLVADKVSKTAKIVVNCLLDPLPAK